MTPHLTEMSEKHKRQIYLVGVESGRIQCATPEEEEEAEAWVSARAKL